MPRYLATEEERAYYREYRRKQYQQGGSQKEKHLARVKARRDAIWEWYKDQKHMKPCTDCGVAYPYYVMDWDHLEDKIFSAGKAATYSIERLQKEIAKCELVCSNCHRQRTFNRAAVATMVNAGI